MRFLSCLLVAVVTGLLAGTYGAVLAQESVRWLRISGFEGGSGYHVVALTLFAFLGGVVGGFLIAAFVPTPGLRGTGKALALSLGLAFVVISAFGLWAWSQRDVPPLIAGERIALEVEVRLPAGMPRPERSEWMTYELDLQSGPKPRHRQAQFRPDDAREEDGRWIVPATIPLTVSEERRILAVTYPAGAETQFFETGIPARPGTMHMAWTPWHTPFAGNLSPIQPGIAFGARLRVVRDVPPAAPE